MGTLPRFLIRFLLLLAVAAGGGVLVERSVHEREVARAALERAERENRERIAEIEAERLARLEAEADLVRAAADAARRESLRNARWTTRPVPRAPSDLEAPGEDEAEADRDRSGGDPDGAAARKVRAAAKAIEGAITPAASGDARGRSEASELRPRPGGDGPDGDAPGDEEKEERRAPGTGLRGEYWKLVDEEIHDFPDVAKRLPAITRVDPRIDFPEAGSFRVPWITRNVAVRWSGYIYAEVDGIYTFSVTSDDGMVLSIDGKTIVDNGGLHPPTTKVADTYLIEGYHAIEVRFFQNEGLAVAVLSWVPMRGEPGPVPSELLYPAEQVRASQAPVIDRIDPPRARSGDTVTIAGRGFPTTPEPVEATFDGVDMRAEFAGPGVIRATLPPGVDRGQVVVRVRDRSSLGFPYESGDIFGLLGEYTPTEEAAPIATLYEIPRAGLPQAFRRVEPMVAFYSAAGFSLPFPARRFGARLRGTLCVHESGEYALKLTSDDGARLTVDRDPTIDIDGLHGMASGEATVFLQRGVHDLLVEYFQNDGAAGLLLEWRRPGQPRFSLVPRRALYPPPLSGRLDPPEVHELSPDPIAVGETLSVIGAGFMGDRALDRVLLNGAQLEIEAAATNRIVVRLPPTARSGNVVVQSGELTSAPVPLTVVGRGLDGAYYRFEDEILAIPDLSGRAPALERRDPSLRFGEGFSFGLPFPHERFAVAWRGTIEAKRAGVHKFSVYSDDGSRLTIGGTVVVDNDGVHGYAGKAGEVELPPGRHPILLEYFNNLGHAALDVWWEPPGRRPERIPETALYPERP
jgi:hypothetical protein